MVMCQHVGVQGHYLLGLKILNMLVTEFNQPTPGRTMTQHRKLAVAFRDAALFKVFQTAITSLRLLQSNPTAEEKLREQVSPVLSPGENEVSWPAAELMLFASYGVEHVC